MEDTTKDQPGSDMSANAGKSKLRYPLRSSSKSKEGKPSSTENSNSSASKRRPASQVSKSMNVLDLSSKEKSAKPPRRLSIPSKSTVSPLPRSLGNITPISEVRVMRSLTSQGKSDTPGSDVSKSGNRRKFELLSSASYWLSQIKLSESAAKHYISLGFFKLALEARCEPLQRVRDELKSYARRHNLVELGEPVKELFNSYNISENWEQLQVSETCSHLPEEGTRSSDDDVHSSCSTKKLKPKSLNTEVVQASPVILSPKKEDIQKTSDLQAESPKESIQKTDDVQSSPCTMGTKKLKSKTNAVQASSVTESAKKKNNSGTRMRGSLNNKSANLRSVTRASNSQKKPQKPIKQESNKGKDESKKQENKTASEEVKNEETLEENKENMDGPQVEETTVTEVM